MSRRRGGLGRGRSADPIGSGGVPDVPRVTRGAARLMSVWLRLCLATTPTNFRERYGREVAEDFRTMLAARMPAGTYPVVGFGLRSGVDLAVQGLRERLRNGRAPGGHGAPPPSHRPGGTLHGLGSDLRFAARGLSRDRGFAVAAVTVLALGIGANTAVFSALRVAVLAPPPFPEPERLVVVDLTIQRGADAPFRSLAWSFPKFEALLEAPPRALEAVAGYANRSAILTGAGPAEMVSLEVVTPRYFDIVGGAPVLGRPFSPAETTAGEAAVVILSHELWNSRFAGADDVLGRTITLNGRTLTVVGVAPQDFDGITGGARLWMPMGAVGEVFSPFMLEASGAHWFHALGRLAPGATTEEAVAQMVSAGDGISDLFPPSNSNRAFSGSARALLDVRSNERARSAVVFLTLAAVLVLLVACANLSGLMLVRARRRAKDGVIRAAIGASRWRLVRASMIESLLLAVAGGLTGIAVAVGGTRAMAAAWPDSFLSGGDGVLRATRPETLGVDPVVLSFAVALTAGAALLFGIGPALRISRSDLDAGLRDGTGATRRRGKVLGMDAASTLVGVQVAMALVLIIGSGLVGGSTLRLLQVDEGFRTDHLLTFRYSMPTTNARAADPISLHDEFLDAVRRLDGVEAATFGCAPLRGHCIITRVDAILGAPDIPPGEGLEIGSRMVDDGHFAALGIPVLRGRAFDARDGTDASPTVVINDMAARALFPGGDALGEFIELGMGSAGKDRMAEIVGVVGDVLYNRPDEGLIPEAYFSYREYPENFAQVTVRTRGEPLAMVEELRSTLARIDPTLAMHGVESMDDVIVASVGDRRTTLLLLGAFALVTILLAGTGTWSIVAYSVADRRREIGLRLALGSERGGVVRVVLEQGVRTALLGVAAGLLLGLASSRVLEALLWETEPTEPVVYLGGAVLLFTLVVMASWLPARRAARVDPVEALKGAN